MNPMALMAMKAQFEQFRDRHPKFLQFFSVAGESVTEDCLIEVSLTTADGKKMLTNMKVTQEDLELIAQMKKLMG